MLPESSGGRGRRRVSRPNREVGARRAGGAAASPPRRLRLLGNARRHPDLAGGAESRRAITSPVAGLVTSWTALQVPPRACCSMPNARSQRHDPSSPECWPRQQDGQRQAARAIHASRGCGRRRAGPCGSGEEEEPFHSIPFHPFHQAIPFHSIPFHSIQQGGSRTRQLSSAIALPIASAVSACSRCVRRRRRLRIQQVVMPGQPSRGEIGWRIEQASPGWPR